MSRTVYIHQKGATLRRQGAVLHLFEGRELRGEIPVHDLGQLVLMGNIILTPSALDLLLDRGVDTVLLSLHGRFRGRIVGGPSGNVRLRMAQYKALSDPVRTLDVARRIVQGKLDNQRRFLLRTARLGCADRGLVDDAARALRAASARAGLAGDLDQLRGCEGSGAAAYFRAFGTLLRAEGIRFDGRNRRPPMDPVNALLSLGYTLLTSAVEAAIAVVGLDPYLGALHEPLANRPSLACDLVEEFRALVVDPLVIAGFNQASFKAADFEDAGPGEPVLVKKEALTWFVTLFERRLQRAVRYEPLGKKLPVRHVIEQQARAFARFVLDGAPYVPHGLRE